MSIHSRRGFLGLFSAISAAVAAGVRLPDAPAKAAEVAPVDDGPVSEGELMVMEEAPASRSVLGPHLWSSSDCKQLELDVRDAIKDCIVVGYDNSTSYGDLRKLIVTYRHAPGRKCYYEAQRAEWEKMGIMSVEATIQQEFQDVSLLSRKSSMAGAGNETKELIVTYI